MRCKTLLVVFLTLALAGCGSSATHKSGASTSAAAASSANASAHAASAFASHAGLAFGTFYRFIYGPYRAGEFRAAAGNRAALARAAAAATYVAAQIEQATAAAHGSAALAKLVAPMKILGAGFRTALVKLKTGHFKMSEIEAANIAISAIKGSSTQAGLPISEATPSAV